MLAMPAPKQKKPAAPVLTKTMKPMRQIQNHLLTKCRPFCSWTNTTIWRSVDRERLEVGFQARQEMTQRKGMRWFTENNDVQTSEVCPKGCLGQRI